MKITNKFEFDAKIGWAWDYSGLEGNATTTKKKHHYEVSLPHSCDNWVITEEVGQPEAIKEMEQFVEEAKEALQKLKSL